MYINYLLVLKGCEQLHDEAPEGEAEVSAPDGDRPARGNHGLHRLLHGDSSRQPAQPTQANTGMYTTRMTAIL